MKTEKEIRERIVIAIDFIINCEKKCALKPTGLYCQYCWRMNTDFELLAWVLDEEDKVEKMRDGMTVCREVEKSSQG